MTGLPLSPFLTLFVLSRFSPSTPPVFVCLKEGLMHQVIGPGVSSPLCRLAYVLWLQVNLMASGDMLHVCCRCRHWRHQLPPGG